MLLHILNNDKEKACKDILRAIKITESNGDYDDPILQKELKVRQESCKQLSNIFEDLKKIKSVKMVL